MARRIYGKNSKSDKLKSKTLQQIRDLRSDLDPDVLNRIADLVSHQEQDTKASELKVDKRKNRETILQALALRDNASVEFLKGVEKLVTQNKT